MKKLKIYKENGDYVLERVNQFGTSFKRRFYSQDGLKEGLDSYRLVINDYKIEPTEDLEGLVNEHINKG